MVRYVISEPVSYQEATPRGLLEGSFEAGPVEVETGSDEHFIIEYVLIPDGYAALSDEQPTTEPIAPPAAPVDPPADDAPPADDVSADDASDAPKE